jgi:hypothetical protein
VHPIIRFAEKVSTLNRFKTAIGWLRRIVRNYKKRSLKTELKFLSVSELRNVMTFAIRIDQQYYYEREVECFRQKRPLSADSPLIHQTPFLDIHSVMGVGGRLDKSAFNEDMKHPIILHQSSNLARLLIQERHVFLAHGRPDRTLHDVRSRYHIGKIRTVVKAVIGNCEM